MVGFALSKSPHWHMTYLVTVLKQMSMTVYFAWRFTLEGMGHTCQQGSFANSDHYRTNWLVYLPGGFNIGFNIGYPAKSEAHSITLQRSVWCFFNLIQISLNALCRRRLKNPTCNGLRGHIDRGSFDASSHIKLSASSFKVYTVIFHVYFSWPLFRLCFILGQAHSKITQK